VSDLYSGLSARVVLVDVLVPGRTNARLTRLKEYQSRRTGNRSTRSTAPANPRPRRQSQHNVAERPVRRIQFLCLLTHHHTIQDRRTTTLRYPYSHRQSTPRTATDNSAYISHPLHHHPRPTPTRNPRPSSVRRSALHLHLHPVQPQLQTYLEQLPATRVGRTASMHAPMLCRGRTAS
jgi:hypothetical protein